MGIFEYNEEEHDKALIDEGRDEGMLKGLAIGKAEGKAEDILDLLEDLGDVSENLRKTIMVQKDLEILKKWFKLAAKAETVEEFCGKAGI